jgi:hypothetical protein
VIVAIFEQVIQYNLVWGSLHLINCKTVYEKCKLFQTRLCKYNLFKNFKYSIFFIAGKISSAIVSAHPWTSKLSCGQYLIWVIFLATLKHICSTQISLPSWTCELSSGQNFYVKRFMKSVNFSKPGYASITCSKISNILYFLIFTTKF